MTTLPNSGIHCGGIIDDKRPKNNITIGECPSVGILEKKLNKSTALSRGNS
jgi:hypothetical protein